MGNDLAHVPPKRKGNVKMTAKKLFEKYSTWRTTREFRNMMDEDQFIQALAEALEGGHLHPVINIGGLNNETV